VEPKVEPTIRGGFNVEPKVEPTIRGGFNVEPKVEPTIRGGSMWNQRWNQQLEGVQCGTKGGTNN
jgi:hypothetical protein